MNAKLGLIVGVLFLLTSCGGSKKASKNHKDLKSKDLKNSAVVGENVPSIDDLPNPLHQPTPNFTSDVARYIYHYKAVAMEEMRTYGIPASITLAQGLLESAAGQSKLTRKSNNHFGIKCHGWKGQKVYHDDDRQDECFRKYRNPLYSFRDHSLFLTSRSRYNGLFELSPSDYKGWARGLKKAGYATDPRYPRKLINLIERYDLFQYDTKVLHNLEDSSELLQKWKSGGIEKDGPVNTRNYTVRDGDTLYSIARRFDMTVADLKALNDLRNNLISIGQVLEVKES